MHLSPLLELLYTARNNFTSIHVSWRYCYRDDLMQTALNKYSAQRFPNVKRLSSKQAHHTPTRSQPETEKVINRRLWWQKPASWHYEEDLLAENTTILKIISEDRFWSFGSTSNKVYSNVAPEAAQKTIRIRGRKKLPKEQFPSLDEEVNDVPIVDPSFLLATHQLTPIEETSYLGREAIKVRGVSRKVRKLPWEPFFWTIADEYVFLVDKERGILLFYSAIMSDQEIAISSVEQVTFDEPIPPDVFIFTPPDNALVEIVS
jgi:hypothetical protein